MSFPTDFCPICQFKLQTYTHDNIGTSNAGLNSAKTTNYFCGRAGTSFIIKMVDAKGEVTGRTEVFHYIYKIYREHETLVEIILHPYMIRHNLTANKTRLYFLPEDDTRPELIMTTSLLKNLDYSKPKETIDKLKKYILFS
jgi:hypothetical protein